MLRIDLNKLLGIVSRILLILDIYKSNILGLLYENYILCTYSPCKPYKSSQLLLFSGCTTEQALFSFSYGNDITAHRPRSIGPLKHLFSSSI